MRGMCSVAQSYQTPCNPMECSPTGSSVHGMFQARILEWAAISCPRGSSRARGQTLISCVSCIGRQVFFTIAPPGSPDLLYGYFLTFLKTFNISTSLHCPAIWKGFLHLVNSYLLFQAHLTPKMAMPTQLTSITSVLRTAFSTLPLKARDGLPSVTLHPCL